MTGVFACVCGKAFATKAAAAGLEGVDGDGHAEAVKDLCSADGVARVIEAVREHGITGSCWRAAPRSSARAWSPRSPQRPVSRPPTPRSFY